MNCARCPEHIDRACLTRARAAGVPARKTILRRRLAPSVSQGVAFRKAWRGSAAQAFRKAWRGSSRAGALSGSARRAGALTSALSKTRLARVPIVRAKLVYARGATWRQSPRTLCATRANLSFGGASRRPSLPPSLSLPSHWISIGSHGSIGSIGSNSNKSVAILAEAFKSDKSDSIQELTCWFQGCIQNDKLPDEYRKDDTHNCSYVTVFLLESAGELRSEVLFPNFVL